MHNEDDDAAETRVSAALPSTRAAGVAASTSTADELVKSVSQLFPEGLVLESTIGRGTVSSTTYAFVPNRRAARFLVPLPNRTSAGKTLRKYSSALTPREITQRTAMSMALHLGGSSVLRDRVTVLGEHRSLRTFLSGWFGEPVTFSVSIGTARVNRKPVLQVFDLKGRTLAYAKVGFTGHIIDDIRVEAAALRQVEGVLPREVVAPRVLGTELWEGSCVMLLSPLAASAWQPWNGRRVPPTRQMQLLNEAFAQPDQLLVETPMWQRTQRSIHELGTDPLGLRLGTLSRELESRALARPVRVGAWHGDWTSWNMARGWRKVLLWDWERFETGVPAGLDHCHFVVNALTRERGFSVQNVLEPLAGLRPAGQHATSADLAVGAYLTRLALRYASASRGPGGHLIAPRASVLLAALDSWLEGSRR